METRERTNGRKTTLILLLAAAIVDALWANNASAVSAPAVGDFAYDIYNIAVTKILQGPIGFVAGCGAIALGAVSAMQSKIMQAVPAILGGAALIKADAIVTTLGAIF